MKYFTLIFPLVIFSSCLDQKLESLESREIVLSGLIQDSIMVFKTAENDSLQIFREIEILENDNSDTVVLGYSVVKPKYTGKIWFIQQTLDATKAAYIDPAIGLNPSDPNAFSKLFTIGLRNKNGKGQFKRIKLLVKLKK